ncbi:ATP-dependent Zn protease [Motilibacter rhizosphaerae]|uniref:ATP-dependent Zn protease n=1 Tax=Motilibacter rhizosphaerae TaxID=598652 RepID=A0A4V2F4D9_9ACTN|nr:AAA family ATPase [Motilibacter rhizosphaerae]RZS87267.1 ATP-dependent Zn protease [Motilibacter rhizosphaerae]
MAQPLANEVLGGVDVLRDREVLRMRRLRRILLVLLPVLAWVLWRDLSGDPLSFGLPQVDWTLAGIVVYPLVLIGLALSQMRMGGRSPHQLVPPERIGLTFDDVVGIDPIKAEVERTLQLFLAHKQFSAVMGGRTRRGLLLEGPPGTGKTYTAKALAAEAGVPFLFATATTFISGLQGASQRKVRQYFRALRKAARKHGGAIGFIDEIDAIALSRHGVVSGASVSSAPVSSASVSSASVSSASVQCCGGLEGLPMAVAASTVVSGFSGGGDAQHVVNELLVQLQSFDEPTGWERAKTWLAAQVNLLLPEDRRIEVRVSPAPNVLLVASTNRAELLDPALLRPGRFDQRLSFDLPTKRGRRELVEFFLRSKAHDEGMATDETREALAAITTGYSPASLEGLLDEALVQALQQGRTAMTWQDVERARMLLEVGVAQPVDYTAAEAELIATHEAGHATVAWLVAPHRRLEILTIIKRRSALGLLAHGDREDVFTRSRAELAGLVQIAFGGQVAEELFFDEVSTGPSGDLQYATGIAAQMVGSAGMAGSLLSLTGKGSSLVESVLGDGEARARAEELLQEQKAVVRDLLEANRHLVAALRDALLSRHELIGTEITDVLEGAAQAGVVGGAPVAGQLEIDLRDGARQRTE